MPSGESFPVSARRWLGPISAVFCTVLVVSNVSAIKPLTLPGLPFITMDGGNLLFPVSYIFGDILVEVYGYAQARRVIWLGFALNFFAAAAFSLVALLPPAPAGRCRTPLPLFFFKLRGSCSAVSLPSGAARF